MGAKKEGKFKGNLGQTKNKSDPRKQPVVVAHRPKQAVPSPSSAPQEAFGGFHRLDEDTIKYFTEAKSHLDGLDDPEEQALLVGNVLEELSGKEVRVSSDPTCSRILESLIPSISEEHMQPLLAALAKGEEFCLLSSSPFGSRVAERLLERLGELLDSVHDKDSADRLYEVLQSLTGVVVAHLWEFATDRNASHVARRLLCVIAGRDVTPAQRGGAAAADGAAFIRAAKQGAGQPAGLAAKMGAGGKRERHRTMARHPVLLTQIAGDLLTDKWSGGRLEELLFHAYACPWLQTLLAAADGHGDTLEELVPRLMGAKPRQAQEGAEAHGHEEGSPLEGISADHVQGLAQDPTSSHFLEVMMRVAPERLLADVYQRFLRGSLARLAMHPSANFVVQAYLAALHGSQQVKTALRELRDALPEMLRGRRSGVAAALLAAAGRTGNAAVQADAVRALASALAALQSAGGAAEGQGLAASLLVHDSPAITLGDPAGRARLSTLGCAMLATVLRLPKEVSTDFAESVADMSPAQLVHMGGDGGGSRALEAFLDGDASAKLKKRVIRKLTGSHAKLAGSPGGSHVVQTCFRVGGVKDKEMIAGELAAAEQHISGSKFGQILLRRCGVEDFKRSADTWRTRAESAAVLRSEFAEMLGEADEGAAAGTSQGKEEDEEGVADRADHDAPPAVAAANAAAPVTGKQRRKGKKAKAGAHPDSGATAAPATEPAAAPAGQPAGDSIKKKKKRKQLPIAEVSPLQVLPEAGTATAGEQAGKKKKKRKMDSQPAPAGEKAGVGDGEEKLSQASALHVLLTGTEAQGAGKVKRQKKPHGSEDGLRKGKKSRKAQSLPA
ncbi:Nucleolar protein 9 [Coccomyxa sp. Obi]|nr:Nucleolar protein 9 [Coccomyxa sp. Obi]